MTRPFDAGLTSLAARLLAVRAHWNDPAHRVAAERCLARLTGRAHAFGFATGREGLVAVLQALGLPPGAGMIAPAFTCPAVLEAIRHCGFRVVPAEIERSTLGLDATRIKAALRPGVAAILMHHLFGRIARDAVPIARFARRHGLVLVEDCAHRPVRRSACGRPGRLGLATLHSFESTKPVPSVCGGAVLTDDHDLADRLRDIQSRWPEPDADWIAGALAATLTMRARDEDARRWMTPRLARLVRDTRPPPIGRMVPGTCRRMPAPMARLLHRQLSRGPALWALYRRRRFVAKPFGPSPDSLRAELNRFPVARRTWAGLGLRWTDAHTRGASPRVRA